MYISGYMFCVTRWLFFRLCLKRTKTSTKLDFQLDSRRTYSTPPFTAPLTKLNWKMNCRLDHFLYGGFCLGHTIEVTGLHRVVNAEVRTTLPILLMLEHANKRSYSSLFMLWNPFFLRLMMPRCTISIRQAWSIHGKWKQ